MLSVAVPAAAAVTNDGEADGKPLNRSHHHHHYQKQFTVINYGRTDDDDDIRDVDDQDDVIAAVEPRRSTTHLRQAGVRPHPTAATVVPQRGGGPLQLASVYVEEECRQRRAAVRRAVGRHHSGGHYMGPGPPAATAGAPLHGVANGGPTTTTGDDSSLTFRCFWLQSGKT